MVGILDTENIYNDERITHFLYIHTSCKNLRGFSSIPYPDDDVEIIHAILQKLI